ncbi:ABC transporter permease [candidate division KSB1 bacterium]
MFGNYIKIAFRNIVRYKGYTFINIFGLAAGIVCCLMIYLYVQDELSYDKYNENSDNIYRIVNSGTIRGNQLSVPLVSGPWGPAMVQEFPEVLNAVRFKTPDSQWLIEYQDKKFFERGFYFTDSTYFSVFTVEMVKGDPKTALDAPFSVVITEEMAEKYFGDEDPLGKIIKGDLVIEFTVTGVMKKHPRTSHMNFDFLASIDTIREARDVSGFPIYGNLLNNWQQFGIYTYILLQENADPDIVEQKMKAMLDERLGRMFSTFGIELSPYLQKMTDIHLESHLDNEIEPNSDIKLVYIFSAVAVFILIIASINYMNLSTARSAARAKEVGLRKVAGAYKKQLIVQFLSESIIFALIASVIAAAVVVLLLPAFNSVSGKELVIGTLLNPQMFLFLTAMFIGVGLISGSYPAFLLSMYRPSEVLSGNIKSRGSSALLRKILVLVQFSLSVVLIIAFSTVSRQMEFINNKDLGFTKDNIIAIRLPDSGLRARFESLKDALLTNSNIISVSGSNSIPGGDFGLGLLAPEGRPASENINVTMTTAGYDFDKTFDFEIIEGRGFQEEFTADMGNAVLINEEAARQFGFETGSEKRLSAGGQFVFNVVGVVKDFHFKSLHESIEPFVFTLQDPNSYFWAFVRFNGSNFTDVIGYVERTWREVNPQHPFDYVFVDEYYDRQYQSEQRMSSLSSFFTVIAILIACLGLFGLASFTAEQRTKEIGIRKVLGASVSGIVLILSREFTKWVVFSVGLAWPIAYYFMGKWLEGFAYRTGLSIWAFIGSGLLTLLIALLTVSYQSIKTAMNDPVSSLRYE